MVVWEGARGMDEMVQHRGNEHTHAPTASTRIHVRVVVCWRCFSTKVCRFSPDLASEVGEFFTSKFMFLETYYVKVSKFIKKIVAKQKGDLVAIQPLNV
jgi:hypothetical protein